MTPRPHKQDILHICGHVARRGYRPSTVARMPVIDGLPADREACPACLGPLRKARTEAEHVWFVDRTPENYDALRDASDAVNRARGFIPESREGA